MESIKPGTPKTATSHMRTVSNQSKPTAHLNTFGFFYPATPNPKKTK